jgi:hypothetical protein
VTADCEIPLLAWARRLLPIIDHCQQFPVFRKPIRMSLGADFSPIGNLLDCPFSDKFNYCPHVLIISSIRARSYNMPVDSKTLAVYTA